MKKIIVGLILVFLLQNASFAGFATYQVSKGIGVFYTDVKFPKCLPTAQYNQGNAKIVPLSPEAIDNKIDIKTLKSFEVYTINILGLVDVGNAGIYEAARKGRITTIHYVEYTTQRVWVPVGFIPVYFKRYITTIYGE